MKTKIKIELSEAFIKMLDSFGNKIYVHDSEKEYLFLPFWFERDGESYYMHQLGDLPTELKQNISKLRENGN